MRKNKAALVCLVAVTTLLSSGSAASAAPKLVFTAGGVPYAGAVGTALNFDAVGSGEPKCNAIYYESQLANGHPRDRVSLTGFSRAECASHEYTFTTDFTEVTFVWNGQVIVHGKATIAGPGPCVYNFTSLIGALEIPGFSLTGNVPIKGSLVRNVSNIECHSLDSLNMEINVDKGAGEFLQTELWG